MTLTGKRTDIINGYDYYNKGTLDGGIQSGVDFFEAPHIYKKEGMYYLVAGHGGTFHNHAVSVWRSKDIFGPYEANPDNPILTHRDLPPDHELTSVGHADFVQTQYGEWWMVYLGRRPYGGKIHILGRETFLSPVDWNGEWPVVNPEGKSGRGELAHKMPGLKEVELIKSVNVNTPGIGLRVTSEGVLYTFEYSTSVHNWQTLTGKEDGRFLGMHGAGRFTGTFIGMYASSNGLESQNTVDFDSFTYRNTNPD